MSASILTDAQWAWVADRWREGYTMDQLADFVGLGREAVRRGLIRHGARPIDKESLPPLEERRQEYIQIGVDADAVPAADISQRL